MTIGSWALWIVIGLLAIYILSETVDTRFYEGFTDSIAVPVRSDIGLSSDGWGEDAGYARDQRYAESFTDVQGHGRSVDFCRAVFKKGDPESLHIACALATRDGMDNMEYRSRTKREGFLFSRDDYYKPSAYCRIVRDNEKHEWYASCAVPGAHGFKKTEERDTTPPPNIRQLLEAYDGAVVWYRWFDDAEDYTGNTVFEVHGRPEFPSLLKPDVSRGLQLNRHLDRPAHDYLRWGEKGRLLLDQLVEPRKIRAIAFWIWFDRFEQKTRVIDCSNATHSATYSDQVWIGVEGGEPDLPPAPDTPPAAEIRPEQLLCIGQQTEPACLPKLGPQRKVATWVFEIWDTEQRLLRLTAPNAKVGEWQHVVVTTTDSTTWWPTWQFWLNGKQVASQPDGRAIPAIELAHNFIGKGVRGCIQDLRFYEKPMSPEKITAAYRGSGRLHPDP